MTVETLGKLKTKMSKIHRFKTLEYKSKPSFYARLTDNR